MFRKIPCALDKKSDCCKTSSFSFIRREKGGASFSWYAEGSSTNTVKIDKSGVGLLKLWHQQLRQFNNVGVEVAQAIAREYSSPCALVEVGIKYLHNYFWGFWYFFEMFFRIVKLSGRVFKRYLVIIQHYRNIGGGSGSCAPFILLSHLSYDNCNDEGIRKGVLVKDCYY